MNEIQFKWDCHHETLLKILHSYCIKEEMTDVTICFEDGKIKAHKVVLSACSAKLENILKEEGNKQIYLFDISKSCMNYLIEFMYKGQVVVPSEALDDVVRAAEYLQIKGFQVINNSQIQQTQTQLSEVLLSSDHLQGEHIEPISVGRHYGLPSSSVRKYRPRPKKPPNDGNGNKSNIDHQFLDIPPRL